ncbi:MAG: DUF3866 family protein [Acidimicrobiales bacterium]
MPAYRTATVTAIVEERDGLQRVETTEGRAYVLTQLVGPVDVGDDVVLNTTGVDLGLGTGGWHVVHWNLSRREWSAPGSGHIMKLRYTSLQADTGAAEEDYADAPGDLAGMPVVACTLHSQAAVVATVLRHLRPVARIVYVMTDGAALPLALSDVVAQLRERAVLDATVTAGHAFGGDLEAVSIPSALALARHACQADVVVAGMGPGVVGTGSALGTTAVEAAFILDATAALGGRPILCVRMSDADERERHRGRMSHHSETVLELARSPVEAPRPDDSIAVPDLPVPITTMGRGPDEDPAFFAACAAAAAAAATHLP